MFGTFSIGNCWTLSWNLTLAPLCPGSVWALPGGGRCGEDPLAESIELWWLPELIDPELSGVPTVLGGEYLKAPSLLTGLSRRGEVTDPPDLGPSGPVGGRRCWDAWPSDETDRLDLCSGLRPAGRTRRLFSWGWGRRKSELEDTGLRVDVELLPLPGAGTTGDGRL